MTNQTIIYLVAALCATVAVGAWIGLLVVPAWQSYSRVWERLAASFLTLYVLATLLVAGALAGAFIAYYWDRIAA
jgi:F0F1-type ATP synthase assembly protein I